ncbi:MAG: bacteriohemerythrin [Thermodesulfobacteriota bacterium]
MLEWNQNLSTGIVEIDEQHKELFRRINRLLAGVEENRDADEIRELFLFFDQYVFRHFGDEERYIDQLEMRGYGEAAGHRSQHQAFTRDFSAYRADLTGGAGDALLIAEFRKFMTNWWTLHILKTDQGLGAFMKRDMPFIT